MACTVEAKMAWGVMRCYVIQLYMLGIRVVRFWRLLSEESRGLACLLRSHHGCSACGDARFSRFIQVPYIRS